MVDNDPLCVRYGHKIRLATTSAYAPTNNNSNNNNNAAALLGIGYYEKNGRHGILSCVPPLGDKLEHLFNEDEYVVLDPSEQRAAGDVVEYGHTVVLVNQHGMVWNNKTGGITGYVGPRLRHTAGEMFVSFRKPTALTTGNAGAKDKLAVLDSASTTTSKTASAPAAMTLHTASSTASNASTSSTASLSMQSPKQPSANQPHGGGPLRYGDANVVVTVVESNRHSQMFNKRLSNFKKPTSRIAGGYICCDGKGPELRFTICPATPRVEQIAMLNKLITTYHYGQKIALPLALLESSCDKVAARTAGSSSAATVMQHAEIVFKLSNSASAVLPGSVLQTKLLAHAVADSPLTTPAKEKESILVLPLRNGPGELVLKLIGVAPRKAIGKIAAACAADTNSSSSAAAHALLTTGHGRRRISALALFFEVVRVLRCVPVPVFALVYAVLTHFLWRALSSMDDGLQRELIVLVLVVCPACYVAVKVDHPFSSLLEPPSVATVRESEPAAATAATLKLIVMEYRFTLPVAAASGGVGVLSSVASAQAVGADTVVIGNSSSTNALVASSGTEVVASTDATALALPMRFLLAEKGDEAKALARYEETLAWRRSEHLSAILSMPSPAFRTIKANYPHYYHKRGKQGEPVYYEKPGKINLKALKTAGLNLDDLMHNYVMVTEFLWQIIESDDNKKCISVIDVDGIGITDFRGEAVEYVKKAAAVSGKHYPERCAYIFVINIPSWFNTIWSIVKTMIDEVTREKVVMVRGRKNILDALQERIPLEHIPVEYGGLSEGSAPEELLLHDLMAFLNQDADAPATNPIAHLVAPATH